MTEAVRSYLDFERPIAELERKIEELQAINGGDDGVDVAEEVARLREKASEQLRTTYEKLDPWQKTEVARHPDRPKFSDYRQSLITEFVELCGDRRYAEDRAIIGGLGRFRDRSVVVMGHEKGRTTETRIKHNFGMARPEGYRKAVRLMDMAERFDLPVITFVDTAGAYPGVGAEERGQSEAIARAIDRCLSLPTPLISVIAGEGGSGGAVALASANHVAMLEHSIYSVISPEGCASILWRDPARAKENAKEAANAMRITAQDLLRLKIIDEIVDEPHGGAHRHPTEAVASVGDAIAAALDVCEELSPEERVAQRRDRFLAIGREGLA